VDLEIYPHFGEKIFQTKAFRRTLHPPVQISHFADRRQLSGHAGKLRDTG
jgi:hypothetical protein